MPRRGRILTALIAEHDRRRGDASDLLVIASSGGHLTQALLAAPSDHPFHLVTNRSGVAPQDGRILSVTVPRLDTHRNPAVHGTNLALALGLQRHLGIARTFTTGGPLALPFAVVGRARRQPFVYLDTLSRVEGLSATARAVRRLGLSTALYSQWPEVAAGDGKVRFEGSLASLRGDRDQ